jgi:alkylation response protein AidB-like acyl-CoA dehydrogenase
VDLSFSPEQIAFRDEVRVWLREALPEDIRRKTLNGQKLTKAEHIAWQQIQAAKGWLAPSWPTRYGGTGWGPVERFIFDEECHLAGVPRANIPAIDLLGPVIIEFGTEEQKQRFLPPILRSEDWWCQGFSEPGAGSDLASLSMRAVRDGDDYVVNGSKIWTSHAQMSNWIFCLVRTSIEEKKHAGISFLLIDMNQPGVTVSPIITVGGVHAVNGVTIDDVRVPVSNLVGREGQAWEMTRFLLGHERLVGASLGPAAKYLAEVKALARRELRDGRPWIEDLGFRDRLAAVEVELTALKYTAYRVIADELAGKAPGPEVSVLKLKGSLVNQALTELLVEIAGPLGLADPLTLPHGQESIFPDDEAYLAQQYFDRRKLTIYGGSAEIQKNIIAQRILRV